MLRLRLRGPNGTANGTFDGAASIESFVKAVGEQLGCAGAKLEMRIGFPPKPCDISLSPLSTVVGSGDTVVINVLNTPPAPAAEPTAHNSSMWACKVCTLKNEAVAAACVACETPRPGGGGSEAQLQKMADDNSCLFHAIAFCLSLSTSPSQMRAEIVQTVRKDPARWNHGTLGKPLEEYCTFISDSRRWGGQVELAIFAESHRTEISVTDIQSGRADVYGQGQGFRTRCYLLFSGIHFDAATVGGSRIFVPYEAAAADSAVAALATELRKVGGFTDQASMRLRCTVCGHIMIGDYEARLHAGQSGHKDFVQDR
mmetsp:Transcript_38997/g.64763  ORF Transcript_38997/g.64763 Transcript_38997/m.64763 type:complete len:314 (+) Transcript_38997:205-1146(+)|eukprot:CAMPEP_0119300638 /NCGR_PEP_ID=MMETSP1333-20130426/2556_1 /TAXON_ID=418940 /ORGANISM="Scyphosphaera apsteinii, Strain RCC1455" /LENGTH=313 /DNA_ID=CAMNT_0007302481 /DNA_START=204 /DNA_END=1145 /DNA_ORIENTATION=-